MDQGAKLYLLGHTEGMEAALIALGLVTGILAIVGILVMVFLPQIATLILVWLWIALAVTITVVAVKQHREKRDVQEDVFYG